MQIKTFNEDLCYFLRYLNPTPDYVFLNHCYILRKLGQDRTTISYSCHRNNQMQITTLYEDLCYFLSYPNQTHRLCIFYLLLDHEEIW